MSTRQTNRRSAQKNLVLLKDLRDEKRTLEDEIAVVQEAALGDLDQMGIKSFSFDTDAVTLTGTKVEGMTLVFDEAKLKTRLGSAMWNKVTTRQLDKTKLEAMVAGGLIDPKIVAACSDEVPKKPYIRITEKVRRN